jgi:hypothetical protein
MPMSQPMRPPVSLPVSTPTTRAPAAVRTGRLARGAALTAAVLTASALAGCGLIDSDVADFDLSLPEKAFTVDATSWDLDPSAAGVLSMSCAGMPDLCGVAAMTACPMGQCSGACSAVTSTCELTIPIRLWSMVNLAAEKPELQQIEDQALVDVTIDDITYAVAENSLDVATPPLTLYVAPATVMDAVGASAVGTVPEIAAMTTVPAGTAVPLTTQGRADMIRFMKDFRAPFNIVVGTDLVLGQGDMIPTGRMSASVKIEAHAGI